jgi:integrase
MSRKEQLISTSGANHNVITTTAGEATPSTAVETKQRLIYQVDEGHRSQQTAAKYKRNFKHFLDYIRIYDEDVFLDLRREAIQELVMKYAQSLRDNAEKKYTRGTVNNFIAPIMYFLVNNDIELNKRKVRRYFPSDESVREDRPYTIEEIRQIYSVCDLRSKAIILLMISSGIRIGAIHTMQIGDLAEIHRGNHRLYKVTVYARTRDKYYSFSTPESYEAIQDYLDYRKRCHEELKDKSPLFRKHFNKNDPFTINVPHFLSEAAVMRLIDEALKKAGVKTSEAMRSHAFRKGFKSICEQSGMKSINIEMLMGHSIGVSGHYCRPAESDILEDYMTHAVDPLTIDSTRRLKQENQDLKTVQAERIARLQAQVDHQDKEMITLVEYVEKRYIDSEKQRIKGMDDVRKELESLKKVYEEEGSI